jgi:DNA polymerase-4
LGITSIGELQDAPLSLLGTSLAKQAAALKELAFGGDDAPVRAERQAPKSMGREVTFARDTAEPEFLRATLLDLADRVAGDLRRHGYAGRTLVIKLRNARFRTVSRQQTLSAPTNTTQVIYEAALTLLAAVHEPHCLLRLLGLTMSGLTEASQTTLDDSLRDRACDEAIDEVRARFGSRALRRAGGGLALDQDRRRPTERSPEGDEPAR